MYYLPEGTTRCGFYECKKCGKRLLDMKIMPVIACPDCDLDVDMEIGPDEEMPDVNPTAQLLQVCEGEEVEKMDTLLSLAITGGDYEWI